MRTAAATVELGSHGVAADDVVAVARHDARVSLSAEARSAMARSAEIVDRLADSEQPTYGVTTGFGDGCETRKETCCMAWLLGGYQSLLKRSYPL